MDDIPLFKGTRRVPWYIYKRVLSIVDPHQGTPNSGTNPSLCNQCYHTHNANTNFSINNNRIVSVVKYTSYNDSQK